MSFSPYLTVGAVATLLTVALVPVVRRWAVAHGVVDEPGGRRAHGSPTPRLGGVAITASILLVILGTLILAPDQLRFVDQSIFGIDRNLLGVLIGIVVLLATGIWDDLHDLNPWTKLGCQALAALAVVAFGVQIHWISNPFGGLVITVGVWSYLLVPLWLLMMINVMNWFDGLDGLTSGLSVIAAVVIIALSLQPHVNQPATAWLAAIVAGAALGFLPWNWFPAKIFMGDSGSMVLGFLLGVFAIISGAKFATAALVLGIPIFDAVWVIGRRIVTGQNPMHADRKHLHHRFLAAGFHPRTAVVVIYLIAAAFGTIALRSGTAGKVSALGWLAGLMVILAVVLALSARRKT
jgi:UDP-GlcNAc:undecaprenyl-phosphate GlcNAc-1-phosphate transferase